MFIYFLIWQVLFVLGWNLRFILKLIMGEDVFIENFILDKIISVAYIIIAFFFFKTLVQATKEKLFYLVFAFFVCGEIVSKLFFAFIRLLDSIRLQEMIVEIIFYAEIIFYIGIPFTPAYFILFLIVWLSLNKRAKRSQKGDLNLFDKFQGIKIISTKLSFSKISHSFGAIISAALLLRLFMIALEPSFLPSRLAKMRPFLNSTLQATNSK